MMMDETLRKAIAHLLGQLEQGNEFVENLLLIEVDWGDHTPAVTDDPVEVDFQGTQWPLVFTDSELVLRRVLCRSPGGKAILVFRSEDGLEVPLDIRARAHKNASHRLGLRYRLYALTGRGWPSEVDYAEWRPSIERHFDELVRRAGGVGLKWDITRSDLEEILVEAAFGIRVEGRQAPQLLADLVSAQYRSLEPPTDLERSLLQGQLRLHQVAWAEVLVWAAAEAGRAKELVRTGVMMGAEQAASLLPNWGSLASLRALLVSERQMPENDAIAGVIELATAALLHLHHSTRESIVKAAQTGLADVLPSDSYNPWFPAALEHESERLAQRLAVRDSDALADIARLDDHLFATQYQSRLSVLDEMASLVMQREEQASQVETLTSVPEWATWYAQQGARMDLTALKLMRHQHRGTGLDESIQRLIDSYWRWRDKLNAAFAKRFVDDYEAVLYDRDSGVFGTHRILDWVVRPRLQEGKRVLLLVVDGMGFTAFWHLLDQWAEQTPPVYVHQPFDKLRTPPQATLSLLPSVTSVSRKGLFLNALPTDRLDDEETYQKKARTGEVQALQVVFQDRAVKLYTKANLDGGQPLINDIQFHSADLIAVVLSAIDDDLRSTTTTVRLPRLEDMDPLDSMVRHALDAGWEVVVTADHGHTWHRDKKLRRGDKVPGGGERFAPVTPSTGSGRRSKEDVPKDAIVTKDPHIVRVQEGKQVALLTAIGTYFGRLPRRGYHGGAGLEEVVVPCAFLTYEAPTAPTRDKAVALESAEIERAQPEGYDLAGVVLTLPDGRVTSLDLPFTLSLREIRLLQALARMGEASESELKRALGTRRIAGPLASLRDRLAAAGLDYIEDKGIGPEGNVYRFRTEMLG